MTTYQWICVLGVPSLVSALLGYMFARFKELKIFKKSVQAILRNELIKCYKEHQQRGFVDIDDRMNAENMWTWYHALGGNGVMDDLHKKFLALPTHGGK